MSAASLRARTVSGLRWVSLSALAERTVTFGTTMVLARLLDPEHFGLYALAFVVIDSLGIFKNLGLDAAIVQRRDRVEEAADTAVVVLPLLGLMLWALLALSAPTVAAWMGTPDVGPILQVLGASLILMSLGNVPWALIQRSMQFHLRAAAILGGTVAYTAVAIVLALRGWGVWSLVTAYLVRWTVNVLLQWVLLGWVPRGRFDWGLLKEMLHFSKYVVGAWVIGFLAMNVDKVAIGKWLGTTSLGYYTLSLGLANIVATLFSERVYQVAFPAFAEAQASPELLRRGFLKMTKYLLLCSLPVAALLALTAPDLLTLIYGERWTAAAPILRVLAVAGVLHTVRAGIESWLIGCGRARAIFTLNVLQLVLLALGSAGLAMAGSVTGVAWAAVVAVAVPCGFGLRLVMRAVGMTPRELAQELQPLVGSILLMAGVIVLARAGRGVFGALSGAPWLWLLGAAPAGGLVYVLGILRWDRPVADDVLHLLRMRLPVMRHSP